MSRTLTDLQLAIMAVLWEHPGLTIVEIHDRLDARHRCPQSTIATLLRRMADKGLVERLARGRAYGYLASVDRDACQRTVATELAARASTVFGPGRGALISSLLGATEPSSEDLREARELLDALESELD